MAQKSISNQLIDTIRERSDLVSIVSEHLSLKKTGQNFTGLCPFHEEKTPSFSVNPIRQFFHCFGCGEGGDVFHFVGKIEGLSFPEAVRVLAERGGISLPEEDVRMAGADRSASEVIFEANAAAADYYHKNLLKQSETSAPVSYLRDRGLKKESIRDFSIGFAPPGWDYLIQALGNTFTVEQLEKAGLISSKAERGIPSSGKSRGFDRFRNRVLFPIRTRQGKVVGFGGRVLDDSMPKYLNTAETHVFTKGKILYGIDLVKNTGSDPLVIVEGYFDVVTAAQAGIPNVVATLGTALTESHLQLVRRLSERMILVFDGDQAGIRAALRTVPLLIEQEVSARIVTLPPGKDPDLLIREMGKDKFLTVLEQGQTVIDFAISQAIEQCSPKRIEEKMQVIRKTLPLIQRLKSQVEKSHYLKVLSDALLLQEGDVRAEFSRFRTQEKTYRPHQLLKKTPTKTETERIPDEEEKILMLLVQGHVEPEALNDYLSIEDFTHPLLNKVISFYWDSQAGQWRQPEHGMRNNDSASQMLISRLAVLEFDLEQVKQIEKDCIKMLCRKKIERERRKIALQLKQVSDNLEEKKALLKKNYDLKIKSSQLAGLH